MKIDLHVHSSAVSLCGKVPVEELIRLYRAAGYDGFVLTDHCNRYTADHRFPGGEEDFGEFFLRVCAEARALGERESFQILTAQELRFDDSINDYLVYGMPDEMLRDWDKLFAMAPADFFALARERGWLVYQAHPFRNGMKIIDPAPLFGIEVHNMHQRHDSRNDIAEAWARRYHLHGISGSDCHQSVDVGRGGIVTEGPIHSMQELVALLREDRYTLI